MGKLSRDCTDAFESERIVFKAKTTISLLRREPEVPKFDMLPFSSEGQQGIGFSLVLFVTVS